MSVLDAEELIDRLRAQADPASVEGMARYGISRQGTLGVRIPVVRKLAAEVRKAAGRGADGATTRHSLAADLWDSGIHEARILAAFVDEPSMVTPERTDRWVADFDSWDVVDQVCANLFDKTPFAWDKAVEWAYREPEYEKRAGFALMAALAWHDKDAPDEAFVALLPHIEAGAADGRNFVKKAVSWALRHIGKRNAALNPVAVETAERLLAADSPAARWVGRDALREIAGEKVRQRLGIGG